MAEGRPHCTPWRDGKNSLGQLLTAWKGTEVQGVPSPGGKPILDPWTECTALLRGLSSASDDNWTPAPDMVSQHRSALWTLGGVAAPSLVCLATETSDLLHLCQPGELALLPQPQGARMLPCPLRPWLQAPSPGDGFLREHWIRAKYEQRWEFTQPEKQEPYSAGYREGFLWKRGRDSGQLLSRKFLVTEQEGALKSFNRNDESPARAAPLPSSGGSRGRDVWCSCGLSCPRAVSGSSVLCSPNGCPSPGLLPTDLRPDPASQAKEPKASMKIAHLNATFQPAQIGHPHGLQVTYLKDHSTRNIFVYHEDGK
ncbi:hypothetical protein MC885_019124, partial [Smutsia gigantea]